MPSPSKSPHAAARVSTLSARPDRGGDVLEPAVILAIEAIGAAAESDELVEIAVVVEVGPGVRLAAGRAEQLGLDQLEVGAMRWRAAPDGHIKRDGWRLTASMADG